jgi:hypothetical protein
MLRINLSSSPSCCDCGGVLEVGTMDEVSLDKEQVL